MAPFPLPYFFFLSICFPFFFLSFLVWADSSSNTGVQVKVSDLGDVFLGIVDVVSIIPVTSGMHLAVNSDSA